MWQCEGGFIKCLRLWHATRWRHSCGSCRRIHSTHAAHLIGYRVPYLLRSKEYIFFKINLYCPVLRWISFSSILLSALYMLYFPFVWCPHFIYRIHVVHVRRWSCWLCWRAKEMGPFPHKDCSYKMWWLVYNKFASENGYLLWFWLFAISFVLLLHLLLIECWPDWPQPSDINLTFIHNIVYSVISH